VRFVRVNFGALILILSSLPVFGQSNAQIENEPVGVIKEIQKYSTYSGNYIEIEADAKI
jgi:hypothetical protein